MKPETNAKIKDLTAELERKRNRTVEEILEEAEDYTKNTLNNKKTVLLK